VGFWFKQMDLGIPLKVAMSGDNYLSPHMQLPDTMDVSMNLPNKMLFTWNSMFGNSLFGEGDDYVLGDKGTIFRDENERVRYAPQGTKPGEGTQAALKSAKALDIVGEDDATVPHMQNFIDCVRSRQQPNCPLEIGFRSAIACQMAVASYRQGRTVRWDEKREEIV